VRWLRAVLDDILLASFVAGSKDPNAYVISRDAFSPSPEPYGIMLRKDDPPFKKVVDGATRRASTRVRMARKLYDKMVHAEDPAQGIESERADRRGAEARICKSFRFPRSGFPIRRDL